MPLPPNQPHLAWPTRDRFLAGVIAVLLAAFFVVLLLQPSAVGRGGR